MLFPLALCRLALCLAAFLCVSSPAASSPFDSPARARVLLFVRTDCPITNRYAPELQRIAAEHRNDGVQFWLVYADRSESPATADKHKADYQLPGTVVMDPQHTLVQRAHATVAPEAAVFDSGGKIVYHGRIDNRWVSPGKSRPAATVHDLEDAIAAAVQGRTVRVAETRAIGCSLADVQ